MEKKKKKKKKSKRADLRAELQAEELGLVQAGSSVVDDGQLGLWVQELLYGLFWNALPNSCIDRNNRLLFCVHQEHNDQ